MNKSQVFYSAPCFNYWSSLTCNPHCLSTPLGCSLTTGQSYSISILLSYEDRCKPVKGAVPKYSPCWYHCTPDQLPEFHTGFYETISSNFFVQGNVKQTSFFISVLVPEGLKLASSIIIGENHIHWTNLTASFHSCGTTRPRKKIVALPSATGSSPKIKLKKN